MRRFGFPVLARRRYEGVAARIELRELHMERVHASCCGVNLAGRQRGFARLGMRRERRAKCRAKCRARDASLPFGSRLAWPCASPFEEEHFGAEAWAHGG